MCVDQWIDGFMRSQALPFVIDISPKNEGWRKPKCVRCPKFDQIGQFSPKNLKLSFFDLV